jgi:excisionase family DNA binding protein
MIRGRGRYFTSAEAAKILDFSEDHIRKLISKGKINAIKLGRNWVIYEDELNKVTRQRFPRDKDAMDVK